MATNYQIRYGPGLNKYRNRNYNSFNEEAITYQVSSIRQN